MKISKQQGVLISLLIMAPYVLTYYWWTKDTSYSFQLTGLFFCGIFLHFLRKIEAGTRAELIFFEKALGVFWNDGLCLVPSILPALHNVGIHLLWNIKKDSSLFVTTPFHTNPDIHHYKDQRIPEYKVTTDATLFQATVYRFFGSITNWFFSLDTKNSELVFQKLGFRIIIVALLLGLSVNMYSGISSNIEHITNTTTAVSVAVVVNNKPIHHFPDNESFRNTIDSPIRELGMLDTIPIYSYSKKSNELYPTIRIEKSLCAVVPAGEKIGFATRFPPVYAANMKNKIHYAEKIETMNIFKRNLAFLFYFFSDVQSFQETSDTWDYVITHWNHVDTDYYNIVAEALDKKDILSNVAGGIVCF